MTGQIARLARTDVPTSAMEIMQVAKFMSASKMLPRHLVGDEASTFSVMLAARSLDIPMWAAFQQIIVQSGRTSMSATLMQSLVIRAGYNLFLLDSDNDHAIVRAERPGIGPEQRGWAEVAFTVDNAVAAKLLDKKSDGSYQARSQSGSALPWELYREDMMIARAVSRAARRFFPDVLMGMLYTPEEMGSVVDDEGIVDASVVTLEPTEEVKAFALRIANAEDESTLRLAWQAAKNADVLNETIGDVSLADRVKLRMKDLDIKPAPPKPAAEPESDTPAAGEIEQNKTEPPSEVDPEANQGPGLFVGSEAASSDDVAKPDTSQVEDAAFGDLTEDQKQARMDADEAGFDELAADAVKENPADPAGDREDTPRRRAVENAIVALFGEWQDPAAEADTALQKDLGLVMDDCGTERLQAWLMERSKGSAK